MTAWASARPRAGRQEHDGLALVALGEVDDEIRLLGVGEYARLRGGFPAAEVAFLVGTACRRRGVATLLLRRPARAASSFGITHSAARVARENIAMLTLLRRCGFPGVERYSNHEISVRVSLPPAAPSSPSGEYPVD